MSDKSLEQLIVDYIDRTDARIAELEDLLKIHREQTVAAFKEMGFDFNKVKIRARVPQVEKPQAVDNSRHLGPTADPIDWSGASHFEYEFTTNAGASQDGDPKQAPIKKSPVVVTRDSSKAQGVSGIVSAGGSSKPVKDSDIVL